MSTERIFRKAGWLIGALLLVAGLAMAVMTARGAGLNDEELRTIRLESRGMAFYLADEPAPNPTLVLAPGERVRFVLANRDRGMEHDVASRELGFTSDVLDGGEETSLVVSAPSEPGTFTYLCTLHPATMRGALEVR